MISVLNLFQKSAGFRVSAVNSEDGSCIKAKLDMDYTLVIACYGCCSTQRKSLKPLKTLIMSCNKKSDIYVVMVIWNFCILVMKI